MGRGSTTVTGTPETLRSSNASSPLPPATSSTPAPEHRKAWPKVCSTQRRNTEHFALFPTLRRRAPNVGTGGGVGGAAPGETRASTPAGGLRVPGSMACENAHASPNKHAPLLAKCLHTAFAASASARASPAGGTSAAARGPGASSAIGRARPADLTDEEKPRQVYFRSVETCCSHLINVLPYALRVRVARGPSHCSHPSSRHGAPALHLARDPPTLVSTTDAMRV